MPQDTPLQLTSRSEVCAIQNVLSPTQLQVSVLTGGTPSSNFTYFHCHATPFTRSSGAKTWTVDERAEVGLLTHNVRVEGDASSSTSKLATRPPIDLSPMKIGRPGCSVFSSCICWRKASCNTGIR